MSQVSWLVCGRRFVSVLVIIVFAAGAPAFLFHTLFAKKRASTRQDTQDDKLAQTLAEKLGVDPAQADFVLRDLSTSRSVSILLDAYSFRHYYMEPLEMLRKLMLVGLTVLAGTLSQLVMGILTAFGFFALLLNQWPYRLAQDNYLRKLLERFACLLASSV